MPLNTLTGGTGFNSIQTAMCSVLFLDASILTRLKMNQLSIATKVLSRTIFRYKFSNIFQVCHEICKNLHLGSQVFLFLPASSTTRRSAHLQRVQ